MVVGLQVPGLGGWRAPLEEALHPRLPDVTGVTGRYETA